MKTFEALLSAYRNTAPSDDVALARLVSDNPKVHFAMLSEDPEGEWKTVHGRHIFIKKGQSVQDAIGESPASKDDKIYQDKSVDISDDLEAFPKGWKLHQDGGLWIMKNADGKTISASGSRAGTIQQAKAHPTHPDFKPSEKASKATKERTRTQADRAMDKLKKSVDSLK